MKIVVGMSGGVDSAVAALLLKLQGHEVIGLFMKNWEEKDDNGICRSSKDYQDVVAICDNIEIPHYSVNFVKEYWENVFSHFIEELRLGYTPNPDILCNREIKFKVFFQKALDLGADCVATGHYAQTDGTHLLRSADTGKDQTYFLYTLKSSILSRTLFPIGHLRKEEVRKIALEHKLSVAAKKDSTGICFIGERNFKQFLSSYIPFTPGPFVNTKGERIGTHDGVAYYTIGQRKGLKIGGAGEAWFVLDKHPPTNTIVIEQGTDHPLLYSKKLVATESSWVSDLPPPLPLHCTAKIRYRQPDQECMIESGDDGELIITFPTPVRAVTPRQSIVFYSGDVCLGGAIIRSSVK